MSDPRLSFLTDQSVIAVSGRDARKFLHAQLTQNIADLPPDRATFAAWADARGRVRALLHVVPDRERLLLVTSADLVADLLSKLQLFVLRDDVALAHAADLMVAVIVGDSRAWFASRAIALGSNVSSVARADGLTWIRIGADLVYAIGKPEAIRAPVRALVESSANHAELALIRSGLPLVGIAQSEQYTPHMLNLDRLGGIAFDKGCYPGQEIVARTENLGAVKRRVRRFKTEQTHLPARGSAVLDASGAHAGEVLRAAPAATGIEILAVVPVDVGTLTLEGSRDVRLIALD
jgi:folate-binding protein YgfZ